MAVKYKLQKPSFSNSGDYYIATVKVNRSLDVDAIVEEMLKRGSTITHADVVAVLHVFFETASYELAEGNSIKTPLVNLRPVIRGRFKGSNDQFDHTRHSISASASAGPRLKEIVGDAKAVKAISQDRFPRILEYRDVSSGTTNSVLTGGGIGMIRGEDLKFDMAALDEGIFISTKEGQEIRINNIAFVKNKSVTFGLPGLVEGESCTLTLRRRFGKSSGALREASLPFTLRTL